MYVCECVCVSMCRYVYVYVHVCLHKGMCVCVRVCLQSLDTFFQKVISLMQIWMSHPSWICMSFTST